MHFIQLISKQMELINMSDETFETQDYLEQKLEDVYDNTEELLEDAEITPEEEGFMNGYNEEQEEEE